MLLAFAVLLFGATAVQAGEPTETPGPTLGSPAGPQGRLAQDADSANAEPASKETGESAEAGCKRVHLEVWVEKADGTKVVVGTASAVR